MHVSRFVLSLLFIALIRSTSGAVPGAYRLCVLPVQLPFQCRTWPKTDTFVRKWRQWIFDFTLLGAAHRSILFVFEYLNTHTHTHSQEAGVTGFSSRNIWVTFRGRYKIFQQLSFTTGRPFDGGIHHHPLLPEMEDQFSFGLRFYSCRLTGGCLFFLLLSLLYWKQCRESCATAVALLLCLF